MPDAILALDAMVTDCNGVLFDVANDFAGCIPGCHEVLRRQGLMRTAHCLDPKEVLSPGQAAAIDRLYATYPELTDDAFVGPTSSVGERSCCLSLSARFSGEREKRQSASINPEGNSCSCSLRKRATSTRRHPGLYARNRSISSLRRARMDGSP